MPDDHPTLRLGALPPRPDPRTFLLARYLTPALPKPPPAIRLSARVASWPMYANDRLSDCTCATAGHLAQLWRAMQGSAAAPPPEASVLAMYSAVNGGRDAGAVALDVLNYWRHNPLDGVGVYAFAQLNPKKRVPLKQAVMLFGGVYVGIALPLSAQRQLGQVWDVPAEGHYRGDGRPGSWGLHAVNIVDYDADGLACVTWGTVQRMTWRFWQVYAFEAWAVLTTAWQAGPPIAGVDFARLNDDLAGVGLPR